MDAINPYEILSYGTIGLGFLLAFLAYRLLSKEQHKDEPRKSILGAINTFMAFSIVLCMIGFGSEFFRYSSVAERTIETEDISENGVLVKLLSARPEATTIGGPEASRKEIERILKNVVSKKLSENCFTPAPDRMLYGKVSALIYKGSNGYANNVSLNETNIGDSYRTCIRDVFRGTSFPEPNGEGEVLTNADTGEESLFEPDYWLTAKIEVKASS